jgi:lipid II:glycine glycyltransferase (peptidoglycan interpeptide bridge formation enzyme)
MKHSTNYELIDINTWNKSIERFPDSHFLQTSLWADVKRENGWEPFYLLWKDLQGNIFAGSLILERTVKIINLIPVKVHYCPKGPLLNTKDNDKISEVIEGLQAFSNNRKGIFIKIDPDFITEIQTENNEIISTLNYYPDFLELLKRNNWTESRDQIQFRNTIVIQLQKSDEDILKDMKQKTRYNIRLSDRKGVKVRVGNKSDFEELFKLYAVTALRDNFVIRSKHYYMNLWTKFYDEGLCEPIIAEMDGEILAAVIIYFYSGKAYYVYGMSSEKNRNLMATYLLQWKAIQRAKEKKCKMYDFWGAPDELNENDRMWGVYKFKLGFGGIFVRTVGAWDFPTNKVGYTIYNFVLPKLLTVMRKIGFRKTQNEIE